MGGDDLGSDDEDYLNLTNLSPSPSYDSDQEEKRGNLTTAPSSSKKKSKKKKSKKRKRDNDDNENGNDDEENDNGNSAKREKNDKKKKGKQKEEAVTGKNLLLVAGRDIANQSSEAQAAFLNACTSHHLRMGEHPKRNDGSDDDDDDNDKQESDDDNENVPTFKPQYFYKPKKAAQHHHHQQQSMASYLKSGPLTSFKKLKKWKHTQSPMVLIVSVSARRAVSILKSLSSLNVRCAKLFAKHMDVKEQRDLLQSHSYGIAVGTPNRLLKLLEKESSSSPGSNGRLSLEHTELVVIDGHEDRKRYTVCTLNDTAPDLASFLKRAVYPELKRRDDIKIAMF